LRRSLSTSTILYGAVTVPYSLTVEHVHDRRALGSHAIVDKHHASLAVVPFETWEAKGLELSEKLHPQPPPLPFSLS